MRTSRNISRANDSHASDITGRVRKAGSTSALDREIASFVPSLTIRIGCDRQMTLGGGQILAQIKGTRADAAT
jgi:hypothetical protein